MDSSTSSIVCFSLKSLSVAIGQKVGIMLVVLVMLLIGMH